MSYYADGLYTLPTTPYSRKGSWKLYVAWVFILLILAALVVFIILYFTKNADCNSTNSSGSTLVPCIVWMRGVTSDSYVYVKRIMKMIRPEYSAMRISTKAEVTQLGYMGACGNACGLVLEPSSGVAPSVWTIASGRADGGVNVDGTAYNSQNQSVACAVDTFTPGYTNCESSDGAWIFCVCNPTQFRADCVKNVGTIIDVDYTKDTNLLISVIDKLENSDSV